MGEGIGATHRKRWNFSVGLVFRALGTMAREKLGDGHFLKKLFPQGEDRGRVGEIIEEQIGFVYFELFASVPTGRHGHNPCSDCPTAFHIQGRVADDPDVLRYDVIAYVSPDLDKGFAGHVVAVFVMISKTAEPEEIEETIMAQFRLGPVSDVSSEQTKFGVLVFDQVNE